jgi:hypothetical protein
VDAIENRSRLFWVRGALAMPRIPFATTGSFFEDGLGVKAQRRIFGFIGQLFVAPENNHAHPVVVTHNLVGFDAYLRIRAHPFDLLSDRGKTVETVGLVGKVDGYDVWLIVSRDTKPATS